MGNFLQRITFVGTKGTGGIVEDKGYRGVAIRTFIGKLKIFDIKDVTQTITWGS